MKTTAVILLLFVVGCSLGSSFRRNNKYYYYYHSLRPNIREAFLQFHLAKGAIEHAKDEDNFSSIDKDHLLTPGGLRMSKQVFSDVESLDPPEGFTESLYESVMTTFHLSVDQVAQLASRYYICIGRPPVCYDVGDVGSNCC